jgi:hypothetical protein
MLLWPGGCCACCASCASASALNSSSMQKLEDMMDCGGLIDCVVNDGTMLQHV